MPNVKAPTQSDKLQAKQTRKRLLLLVEEYEKKGLDLSKEKSILMGNRTPRS